MPKKLWITYAWKDNEQNALDFVVQELRGVGIDVKIDRFSLSAGKRLWEQIGTKISDSTESDAWALYATENSLQSEPCKEELAIAIDRALRSRGDSYPLIGIFPGSVAADLIPPAIRTRLYVSLRDSDWVERVKSAIEGRAPQIGPPTTLPVFHRVFVQGKQVVVEARPRVGRWYPSFVLVPMDEVDRLDLVVVGPSGTPRAASMTSSTKTKTVDGRWHVVKLYHEATPTQSLYAFFNRLPSRLGIGPQESPFEISL